MKHNYMKTPTKSPEHIKGHLKVIWFTLLLVFSGISMQAQTVVNSLAELQTYLDDDNVHVKLAPGSYSVTAEDVENGLYKSETTILGRTKKVLLLFEGNNSTYDFTDVTINVETAVFQAFGNFQVYEIQIIGNENVLKNLTLVDVGSVYDRPTDGALNICMDGARNRIEGFDVTVKGSYPYGYGDAFGKGGGPVIGHNKHSACLIRGESNHLKDTHFTHRSYGHCIFMQAASNPLIEGCTVEGEVRTTDDMLAEEGTGSPADEVDFMTVWGYKLPPGYMLSTGEAGIRAYNGGETVIDGVEYSRGTSNPTVLNCTIKYMRTGVTVAHATGTKYVEGTTAIGCENGFSLGSGDVVDCKADCTYGPVYASTYESDSNYNADIEIIPASDPYYNGSGSVAYIGGSGHEITLRGAAEALEQGLKIKVGGDKNNIRLLYGNLPHQNNFSASDFEINNLTNYPIFLSEETSGITGQSGGMVTDLGTNNDIQHSSVSVLNIESEDFSAMNGVETEATSDGDGGEHVTAIDAGDWMEYEIEIPYSGSYNMDYRVASATSGDLSLSLEGEIIENKTFPETGGDQEFATTSSDTSFYLSKGNLTLRVVANNGGWNINKMNLLLECAEVPIEPYIEEFSSLGTSIRRSPSNELTVFPGNTFSLDPNPQFGGSWSWSGPNGFSANAREVTLQDADVDDSGEYLATYTNDCGFQVSLPFNITVQDKLLIEAENYADMSGIETASTTDENGGEMITSIDANDWVEYTLDIPVSGTYGLDFRVAGEDVINFGLTLNGNENGTGGFSSTGGLQSWSTESAASELYLPAGEHTLRITANNAGWNLNWIRLQSKDFVNPCNLPFEHQGFTIQNDTAEWSSGILDISCVEQINAYVSMGETGTLTANDSINVYYRLNGGEQIAVSETTGSLDTNAAIVRELTGNTFELIINGSSESTENFYTVSAISIVETTDPFAKIEAEDYDDADGPRTGDTGDVGGGQNLGAIQPGDWSMYANLDLTDVKSINARLASIYDDAFVEVRIDSPDGRLIGTVDVPQTGGWQEYETVSAFIEDVTGTYDVYLVYQSDESPNPCNINWLQFSDAYVAPPIEPFSRFEAENFDAHSGVEVIETSDSDGEQEVTGLQNGDWISFESLDITNASSLDLRVASANDNAQIELRLDAVDGQLLSTIDLPNSGSINDWETINASVDLVDGEYDVYLVFAGQGDDLLRLNWLQFNLYVNPFDRIEAEDFDEQFGDMNVAGETSDVDGGGDLRAIFPGDWIKFNAVELTGANSVSARFGSLYDDAFIEVRVDAPDGELIGTIDLQDTGGWHNWETTSTNIEAKEGAYDLYFIFDAETSPNVCNINWFQLSDLVREETDPFARLESEDYDEQFGDMNVADQTSDVDGGGDLRGIVPGDWIKFNSVDLTEAGSVSARFGSQYDDAFIEVRLDAADGDLIGTIELRNTGGWHNWETLSATIEETNGTHDVYFIFQTETSPNVCNINWFQFHKNPIVIEDSTTVQAEDYFTQSGVEVQPTSDEDGNEQVGKIDNGDQISFNMDVISADLYNVSFRVSPQTSGSSILLRKKDGSVQEVTIPDASENENWITVSTHLNFSSGVQSLSLEFAGESENLFALNWISFEATGLELQLISKSKGSATNNSIATDLEIVNAGADAINLDDLTVRYWFTAEEYASLNFWCDYAQMGKQNISATFENSTPPRAGALSYMELSFNNGIELDAQSGTGVIKTRFAKSDWSDFDQTDDYSFLPSNSMLENDRITMYVDGSLVWGTEPEIIPVITSVVLAHKNGDNSASNNALKPHFDIRNTGNTPVSYSDLSVRYWFTSEGDKPINVWTDWAEIGENHIDASITDLDSVYEGADHYLELRFIKEGVLNVLSSTGDIKTRVAKSDWSAFDETNDYSFIDDRNYSENPKITVYLDDELVWGTEPSQGEESTLVNNASDSQASSGKELAIYPNPVRNNLNVNSLPSEFTRYTLFNMNGQPVKQGDIPAKLNKLALNLDDTPKGIYILKLSGKNSSKTVSIIKQ